MNLSIMLLRCLYGIWWQPISNWCLVRERDKQTNPLVYFPDGLTVSGNRLRRVRDVDLKHDFAFIEFSDPRDADDARYHLNGRNIDGSRIVVEFAKGGPRGGGGSGGDRYLGKGPPPGSGRCFNCGLDGHWARDCKAGDWKNKCYRCGERGHIERSCPNSPKSLKRGRSYSRSPSRSRSPPARRGRTRSRSLSRSRSYNSRSRSPRRDRSLERSRSPPPSKGRKRSPTPAGESPREGGSPISKGKSRSPSLEKERYPSPSEANGRSPSASPRATDRSPMEDDGGRGGSGSPSSAQD